MCPGILDYINNLPRETVEEPRHIDRAELLRKIQAARGNAGPKAAA